MIQLASGCVDSHHHIWRQQDLPWLHGPMQPRIFGPYEPIRRDYTIAEYLADVASAGVTRSVYVQANWAKERFLDEVRYVSDAASFASDDSRLHSMPRSRIQAALRTRRRAASVFIDMSASLN